MRILVVGGTGFIGRFLIPDLVTLGQEVTVFHRGTSGAELPPGVSAITGDRRRLADSSARLRAFAPDVVIDAVLSSGAQARALMKLFRGVARRVVALSSMDVYRACGVLHGSEEGPLEPLPLTEDSPLRTKLQTYPAEQIQMLQQVFGWLDDEYDKIPVERTVLGDPEVSATVLRLPMMYGPGDHLHRFFPTLKRMDDKRRAIVMQESAANWRSPRGYVENVAAAITLAATSESAAGRVYNVGEAESFSEIEWARQIGDVVGWAGTLVPVAADRLPPQLRVPGNLAQHWTVDTTRIRRELGYREPVERAEAIRRTVEWERANPPAKANPGQFDYSAEDQVLEALHI